jgi:hypothetical protein
MAFLKYVEKRKKPAEIDNTAADRGTAVHSTAESYVKGEAQQLAPEMAKVAEFVEQCRDAYAKGMVEVEEEWAFDRDWQITGWFDKNCWLRLKLDVFIKWPDGTWEVVDWKTGKSYGNEVKHSQQGLLYAIGAFMRYPEMQRVRIRFVYTDEGKWNSAREYDRLTVMRMLPTWDERAHAFTDSQSWPVRANAINCKYCWFGPNNGGDKSCPAGVESPPAKASSISRSAPVMVAAASTSVSKSRGKKKQARVRRLPVVE